MRLSLTHSNVEVDLPFLRQACKNLTFNQCNNLLGLTTSDVAIDLSHLVNDAADTRQDLIFHEHTNHLAMTKSSGIVDLSHLGQDLTFNGSSMLLGLTESDVEIGLSFLANCHQDLTFDPSEQLLGLTRSESTVDLGFFINDNEPGIQDLGFDAGTNQLSLTSATEIVDLSNLDTAPQDLKLDNETMELVFY